MRLSSGRPVFSPSDLNHFLECEHLIQLGLRGVSAPREECDPHAELLAAKGIEHEKAWLEKFRADGLRIVEIAAPGPPSSGLGPEAAAGRDWARDAERTIAAIREGADVIYQGVFVADGWRGISDFLVRVRRAGPSGPAEYEPWDTKLARSSKPYFILQLCFYAEQIGRLQGHDPEHMHIVLGTGQIESFRYQDFAAYYRAVRRRFVEATQASDETYPYPVSHCAFCHHQRACQRRWYEDDHLSQLAGITREQVARLNSAGITTIAALARLHEPPAPSPQSRSRIGAATLARLQHQAQLQSHHRATGKHRYELLEVNERIGFRLLPQPSEGDIFFDMEGDPYFEPAAGLEYLFGAVTVDRHFTAFQALTRDEEKRAFERFVDWVHERLAQWPDLHVYHYAAYEITALKRLMSVHATREEELDHLLRREVFVDLYQVVRQSLRHSHGSYSIKKVRQFFMAGTGQGAVTDGGDSILQFEQFRDTGDQSLLQAIIDYNREDCVSTLELRDWLLERKADAERVSGTTIPWKPVEAPTENPKREAEDAETAQRVDALRRAGPFGPANLLALLLNYHRREAKAEWWAFFDRQKKGLDELLDDTQAIAWLEPVAGEPEVVKQSLVYTLRFPAQEYKLTPGTSIVNPFTGTSPGELEWVNGATLQLGLKRGKRRAAEPMPVALCAGAPIDDAVQRAALGRVADAVIAGSDAYAAVRALLARDLPHADGQTPDFLVRVRRAGPFGPAGEDGQIPDPRSPIPGLRAVAALDHSYLFIQGPPGSGKTYTGARLIVSLLAAGKRIGVAANSHKAINNLLKEVEAVALAERVTFQGLKKGSGDDALNGQVIRDTDSNDAIESAASAEASASQGLLVAGTAWLFSRPALDQSLDYLFIDEAGQVALADAVAMAAAARNLVLLGDPQQLPQVRQGVHPEGAGVSVLEHLLDGASTVAPDRGIFLAHTWRLHPEICRFVSDLSYDGRLESAPGRERQRVSSSSLSGSGLRYIPVPHTGNAQRSEEEAEVIAAHIERLLDGGTFTDHDGRTRPLTPIDILVVAPYNMHMLCLQDRLPTGIEVGTVDKFQGREAPVVFFSMASSTGDDVPRGLEFLFSRNRFNVAISRARALAVLVSSPRLMDVKCRTVEQMRLANMICRYVEQAR